MRSIKNPFWLVLPLFVLFLTILWSSNSVAGLFSSDPENTPLPAFKLPTLSDNQHLTNKTFLGKVSLLNIWASWCGYCRNEHDMLMKIKNNYHVPMYGINNQDNPEDARSFLKNNGNPFVLVGVDSAGVVGSRLDLYGTPETYIIDKHGVIRYRQVGGISESTWNNKLWPMIQNLRNER